MPLDEDEVEALAPALRDAGVEAIAVCFLHAWTNHDHERRAVALIRKLLPEVEVVASHHVSAQWREYERSSTAVLAAYVKPVVANYLGGLTARLRQAGVRSVVRHALEWRRLVVRACARLADLAPRVRAGRRRDGGRGAGTQARHIRRAVA